MTSPQEPYTPLNQNVSYAQILKNTIRKKQNSTTIINPLTARATHYHKQQEPSRRNLLSELNSVSNLRKVQETASVFRSPTENSPLPPPLHKERSNLISLGAVNAPLKRSTKILNRKDNPNLSSEHRTTPKSPQKVQNDCKN